MLEGLLEYSIPSREQETEREIPKVLYQNPQSIGKQTPCHHAVSPQRLRNAYAATENYAIALAIRRYLRKRAAPFVHQISHSDEWLLGRIDHPRRRGSSLCVSIVSEAMPGSR